MRTKEVALLIQDAVLLPGGRLEISVVTPSDLCVVADVLKGYYELAFAPLKVNSDLPCYIAATQCNIIDFNQLDNGCLSIIIEGSQRLKILSAAKKRNGCWIARALPCPNWTQEPIVGEFEIISAALEQFYQVNPNLLELYSQTHLEDAAWVSQRWLEVLPMYNRDKLILVEQPNCHKTMDFVLHLLKSYVDV
ncbi:LON peptidase substrate-binding domain-containing protein [Shewanella sp. H8]|uniref:LON peptidase substrate-binding domain-containing protein n=1 Tax=Shewanella sp. H8 TaxID=3342676 RepID=UPI0033160BB8